MRPKAFYVPRMVYCDYYHTVIIPKIIHGLLKGGKRAHYLNFKK